MNLLMCFLLSRSGTKCSAMLVFISIVLVPVLVPVLVLVACERAPSGQAPQLNHVGKSANALSEAAQLGKKIFFDQSLSGSGKMSCATCHDPHFAYGPPNDLPAQLGGRDLHTQGLRAVPSLRYVLPRTPIWSKQFIANPAERLTEADAAPAGGYAWDGRFDTLHEQALAPLLANDEMANASPAVVIEKVKNSAYAVQFENLYGQKVWANRNKAMNGILAAIERFELEDDSFHPYSSKFDQVINGTAKLTPQELNGLNLFSNPEKGNCASCHVAQTGANNSPPLFTDFGFSALGAPRNIKLSANRDPKFFDLGLCGPLRSDQSGTADYCGLFKTPGLRNVAMRKVFLHNGVFTDLETVVRFYVERDTKPEKWYPVNSHGVVEKFNDLPAQFRKNVDTVTAPLNKKKSDQPALNDQEIKDVVAFLGTLSDQ